MNQTEYLKEIGKKAYCWSMCKHSRATFIGVNLGMLLALDIAVSPDTGEWTQLMQNLIQQVGDKVGYYSPYSGVALLDGACCLGGIITLDLLDEYAMPQVDRAAGFLADKYYPALRDWYHSLP